MLDLRRVAVRIALGLCAAAMLALSCYALLVFAPKEEQFRIPFSTVACSPAPSYVGREFLAEVRTSAQLPEVLDMRAPDLAQQLQQAFARHPWVAKVDRVALQGRRRVEVELHYRVPVAVVVIEPDRYLVDRDGFVLPRGQETAGVEAALLQVRGIVTPPLVAAGKRWDAAGLLPAARIADRVASHRDRWNLGTIEIGADPLQPDLRLRTRNGTMILWESLAGDGAEAAAATEKIRRLQAYCDTYGSLDAPDGPYLLDVRPASGLLRRRLRP